LDHIIVKIDFVKSWFQSEKLWETSDYTHFEMEALEIENIVLETAGDGIDETGVLVVGGVNGGATGGVGIEDLIQSAKKVLIKGGGHWTC
jgi:hypothetical protein